MQTIDSFRNIRALSMFAFDFISGIIIVTFYFFSICSGPSLPHGGANFQQQQQRNSPPPIPPRNNRAVQSYQPMYGDYRSLAPSYYGGYGSAMNYRGYGGYGGYGGMSGYNSYNQYGGPSGDVENRYKSLILI